MSDLIYSNTSLRYILVCHILKVWNIYLSSLSANSPEEIWPKFGLESPISVNFYSMLVNVKSNIHMK